MGILRESLGEWTPETTYRVTTDAIEAYAKSVNETNPLYFKGADSYAPPLFAIVAAWDTLMASNSQIMTPDLYMQVVHLIQDMRFERAIRAGDILRVQGRAYGIVGGRSGTSGITQITVHDQEGDDLVCEMFVTFYVRGHTGEESWGEPAPEIGGDQDGSPATVTERIDADQTYRYANASGDQNPIHQNDEFAKGVGLPGIIVHGMCTLAFAARAVVDTLADGDVTQLKRLAGQFSAMVFPGQDVTTTVWPSGAFETSTQNGTVVKNGIAVVEKSNRVAGTKPID